MAHRYEQQVTIAAPASKVFDYVSDMTKHGEWGEHGLQVTADGSGPVAVGSTYSTVAKQFGTQKEKSTVTDYNPGSLFGWDSTGALGTVHHWFQLSEEGGSTKLTKGFDLKKGSFVSKLFGFRIKKQAPHDLSRDLERIKAKVEGSAT